MDVIKKGDDVMIKGMGEIAKYNRLFGKVIDFDEKTNKWRVKISHSTQEIPQHIAVAPDNLSRVLFGMLLC